MAKQEFYFQWHINNNCNLRCSHCYQDDYLSPSLNMSSLSHIHKQISCSLAKWNMLGRVSLSGGEPFLSPYLFPLMRSLDDDDNICEISILSNGTLIDDDKINELSGINKLREIQISLDGSSEQVHDLTRGIGAYAKAIAAIERLRKAGIRVAVMFTLTRKNMMEAVDILKLCEKLDVNSVTIERVTPLGHCKNNDILTSDELKEIYTSVTKAANGLSSHLTVRRTRSLWILTQDMCANENLKLGGFCPVGYTSLTILHDGTVLPCRRLNIPIGNLLKESLFKIWYGSDVLWEIRDKNNLHGKCRKCVNLSSCGGCRAIAYETTGDYMGEDPQCWMD